MASKYDLKELSVNKASHNPGPALPSRTLIGEVF